MTNSNTPPYTTLLHQRFQRVVIESYHAGNEICYSTTYGSDKKTIIDNATRDDLIHYVLNAAPHSFVFVRSDGIRVIKVYDDDNQLITDMDKFLEQLGISITSMATVQDRSDTGRFYQRAMENAPVSLSEQWAGSQVRVWQNIIDTSIGAGANKEMVEVSTFGGLMPEFDIALEQLIDAASKGDSDISKTCKYLGRLLRPFRYYTFNEPSIRTIEMKVDTYIDGLTGLVDHHWLLQQTGLALEPGDRLEWTMLDAGGKGLLKGHGLVADLRQERVDVVLYGDQHKTQIKSTGLFFAGFEHLKGSETVYLDQQTLINMFSTFKDILPTWAENAIGKAFDDAVNCKAPQQLIDLGSAVSDSQYQWALRRMANHRITTPLPVLMRRVWQYWKGNLAKYELALRVPIPGAIRRYVTPDLDGDVRPGHIKISKGSFMINRNDSLNWFHKLHGGSDSDDSFVLIPIRDQGRDRVLLYRNPNQHGEWSVLDVQSSDHEFRIVNLLPLPTSQRANWKSSQTAEEIMKTVSCFWDYLATSNISVETALIGRIPKSIRDQVATHEGEFSRLVAHLAAMFQEAEADLLAYMQDYPIPANLKLNKNHLYPVAEDIDQLYGTTMRRILSTSPTTGDEAAEIRQHAQIERLHSRIRGILSGFNSAEQKLIIENLFYLRYTVKPGKQIGEYTITQANDGVLGIKSSKVGNNKGTMDILLDYLVDRGNGLAVERDMDSTIQRGLNALFGTRDEVIETRQINGMKVSRVALSPLPVESRGKAVRVYGLWRQYAENRQLDPATLDDPQVEQMIEQVHIALSMLDHVTITKGVLFDGTSRLGMIARSTAIPDGLYKVLNLGEPGKSVTLYLA